MTCEQLQEKLSEYLDRSLDREARAAVENHLSSCAPCRAEAEMLARSVRGVADLPSMEPPFGFSQRVMARIREEARKPGLWDRLFLPLRIKVPIHASALLLIGALGVYLYQVNRPVETELAKSVPAAKMATLRPGVSSEKDRDVRAAPGTASSLASLEDKTTALGEASSGGIKGRAKQAAHYEITFRPRKSLEGAEILGRRFDDLIAHGSRALISPKKQATKRPKLSESIEKQTVWLTVQKRQYEQFKADLASLGKIEAEKRVPPAAARAPGEASESLQIKLTILTPTAP